MDYIETKKHIESTINVDDFWNKHLAGSYGVAMFDSRSGIICPFHDDVKPSFKVYGQGNLLHCFGCQTTLGVVSSLVRVARLKGQAMTEQQAVETICEWYGIDLPSSEIVADGEDNFFAKHRATKGVAAESRLERIIAKRGKIDKSDMPWESRVGVYADLDLEALLVYDAAKGKRKETR